MNGKTLLNAIGLIATILGFGAELAKEAVDSKKMEEQIAKEVAKQLGKMTAIEMKKK